MTSGRSKRSAGILLYRRHGGELQVLIGHMGGPFWARKDAGAWSIPKGEYAADEEPEAAARREFREELGVDAPVGALSSLGEVRQSGGKTVAAWALEGDLDPDRVVPGTFRMEWPRGSGAVREFPELDRLVWLGRAEAHAKLVSGQRVFLDRLTSVIGPSGTA